MRHILIEDRLTVSIHVFAEIITIIVRHEVAGRLWLLNCLPQEGRKQLNEIN